jgi:signal transduction histidine kinase/NO-binding membrane sensor protein with MHYT domain
MDKNFSLFAISPLSSPLPSSYNLLLVALSIAIAMLAAYAALDAAGRISATLGRSQLGWGISGALAMGIGIWAMHFLGMLAFRLPVAVHYDFLIVLASVAPAIVASGVALWLVSRGVLERWTWIGGSLFMGSGIATMHYLGMAAMEMDAAMAYQWPLVALSVAIAIAVSSIGLGLVFSLRDENTPQQTQRRLVAALLMGSAIPTMHYTGMAAVQFLPTDTTVIEAALQPPENDILLVIGVVIGTVIILGIVLLSAFFDRQLDVQKAYNTALAESQQYLNRILQGIQVGVLVIEKPLQIKSSNQAALGLLQVSQVSELQTVLDQRKALQADSEAASAPVETDEIPPSLRMALTPVIEAISTQQSLNNVVINISTVVGQRQTALLVNAVAVPATDQSTAQTILTFSEITELKQAEQRLQASEAQFRSLARQEELLNQVSTQIRQSLDLQTILQTAVREVRQLFATDRALIYQFDAQWCGQVVLEEVLAPWPSTLGEAADDCFPKECLARYQQGQIRTIHNIEEAGLDPEHLRFLRRLQVQANLIVPIQVQDQLWGLLIVHQCDRPRHWQPQEEELLTRLGIQLGIAIQQSDLYAQAEQSARQAQAQAQQLRESQQQLQQKATDLQQALKELQGLQIKLVHSEKMSSLGQLVAGIAHEINNPVNFIHGNLSCLQEYTEDLFKLLSLYQQELPEPSLALSKAIQSTDLDFLQEDWVKILNSMGVGTQRIRQIVLSLRNFSRLDEADFKAVDIHEGLESTLLILQHRFKARPQRPEITVVQHYGDLPLVECYPGQLNQVFMNILANAADALDSCQDAADGPGNRTKADQITLTTHRVDDRWVEIIIADNGPGIPKSLLTKVFDPFFTTKPMGKGTGMGLSISYQIIAEKHGGKLLCASSPGQGTTFTIRIPIQQKPA